MKKFFIDTTKLMIMISAVAAFMFVNALQYVGGNI